jgi:hypothetical protein
VGGKPSARRPWARSRTLRVDAVARVCWSPVLPATPRPSVFRTPRRLADGFGPKDIRDTRVHPSRYVLGPPSTPSWRGSAVRSSVTRPGSCSDLLLVGRGGITAISIGRFQAGPSMGRRPVHPPQDGAQVRRRQSTRIIRTVSSDQTSRLGHRRLLVAAQNTTARRFGTRGQRSLLAPARHQASPRPRRSGALGPSPDGGVTRELRCQSAQRRAARRSHRHNHRRSRRRRDWCPPHRVRHAHAPASTPAQPPSDRRT